MAKGQIKARVQCVVEIPVGVWSGGTIDTDGLAEQVREEGRKIVQKMVSEKDGRVIGVPKVSLIVFSEE